MPDKSVTCEIFIHWGELLNFWNDYACLKGRISPTQLFSTNTFSANTFSLNVLPSFTAIYSQSNVDKNNFFTYFYRRKQLSRKLYWIY